MALLDADAVRWIGHFAPDDVAELVEELASLPGTESGRAAACEALGIGAFEKPGGGPPVRGDGLLHGPQRAQLGIQLRATKLFFESGVPLHLAADRIVGAAHEMGSIPQATTAGDQPGDLGALELIQHALPAATGLLGGR